VGPHHAKGLLDAQVKRATHGCMCLETFPPRVRRRLASELPACASPSSTAWQVSRAAARSSTSSRSEES
jgi:hypothetical protein